MSSPQEVADKAYHSKQYRVMKEALLRYGEGAISAEELLQAMALFQYELADRLLKKYDALLKK